MENKTSIEMKDRTKEDDKELLRKTVESRLEKVRSLLVEKAKEYVRNDDPFHNFNRAAQEEGKTPQEVLHGFMLKHYISYKDMLDDLIQGKEINPEKVDEKFGDLVVYLILQEALFYKYTIEKHDEKDI